MRLTEGQSKMVEENHNLIYGYLSKNNLNIDDYYDLAAIGLCKAAIHYDPNRSKFSTLAYTCMGNEIKGYLQSLNKKSFIPEKLMCSYDISLYEEDESFVNKSLKSSFDVNRIVIKKIYFWKFFETLTEREKFIIKCFENDLDRKEIASKLNISLSLISRNIKGIKIKWIKFNNSYN